MIAAYFLVRAWLRHKLRIRALDKLKIKQSPEFVSVLPTRGAFCVVCGNNGCYSCSHGGSAG